MKNDQNRKKKRYKMPNPEPIPIVRKFHVECFQKKKKKVIVEK